VVLIDFDFENAPLAEAVDYLAQKANLDTDTWRDGAGVIQDAAFTVAAAKGALLQEIREAVEQAIADGQSVDAFKETFNNIADRWVNNWNLKGDRAWRAELIYQENVRGAYRAGRYQQMTDAEVLKSRPAWQWFHGGSISPRPAHLALDRKIFFIADENGNLTPEGEAFLPMFPRIDWGCKCTVQSLSQRDVDRIAANEPDLLLNSPPSIGQEFEVEIDGRKVTEELRPGEGFGFVPGRTTPEQRRQMLERLRPEIRELVQTEVAETAPEEEPQPRVGRRDDATFTQVDQYSEAIAEQITEMREFIRESLRIYPGNVPMQNADAIISIVAEIANDFPNNYLGVVDEDGNTQAVAFTSSTADALVLNFLATAPWNIRGAKPDDRAVSGAASQLIKYLAQQSIDAGFEGRIKLTASDP
jgi:hypothetical protein